MHGSHSTGGDLAGARVVGRDFGGHLREENDETNPMVLTTTANNARRRPATRRTTAAARVARRRRAPVVGDEGEVAAELPHTTAHLKATAASGCDGGGGCATTPGWVASTASYEARETTGEGANERGGLGGPIYSLGSKRSDSKREESKPENQKLGFGDKLKNEFDSDKI